ncbi:ArsR/SmtB family transcription factor [Halobium palmae]|uniref:ArsR/SmtB family transcription factor n=1 Tax=Halobium palmae TaxID=1776492 RepID=A0ABD5RX25_9EURY
MSSEWEAGSLFDLFGDEVVREILALTSVRPCSADELSDHCDASGPTVYRRLESLCDYDLLDESVAYDDDGNHYRTYECRLREVRIGVDEGSFAVDVSLEREIVDDELGSDDRGSDDGTEG